MDFIEQCLAGDVLLDEIDDFVDKWHDGEAGADLELHEFLGMSWEEYQLWGTTPSIISSIVSARRKGCTLEQELEQGRYALAARASTPTEAKKVEEWLKSIGKIQ